MTNATFPSRRPGIIVLPRRHTAIDDKFGTGHPTRFVARQEKTAVGNVDGLAVAPHRCLGETGCGKFRIVMNALRHGRGDEARMDGIHPNVFGGVLQGGGFRCEADRAFRRMIGRVVR